MWAKIAIGLTAMSICGPLAAKEYPFQTVSLSCPTSGIITLVTKPDKSIVVAGEKDMSVQRSEVGFVIQYDATYEGLTISQSLFLERDEDKWKLVAQSPSGAVVEECMDLTELAFNLTDVVAGSLVETVSSLQERIISLSDEISAKDRRIVTLQNMIDTQNMQISDLQNQLAALPNELKPETTAELTDLELKALSVDVSSCWNVGSLSTEALGTSVVVNVEFDSEAKPITDSIELASSSGGSDAAARQAFEAARRAIIRCGARGFDLPPEKRDVWRELTFTFSATEGAKVQP